MSLAVRCDSHGTRRTYTWARCPKSAAAPAAWDCRSTVRFRGITWLQNRGCKTAISPRRRRTTNNGRHAAPILARTWLAHIVFCGSSFGAGSWRQHLGHRNTQRNAELSRGDSRGAYANNTGRHAAPILARTWPAHMGSLRFPFWGQHLAPELGSHQYSA